METVLTLGVDLGSDTLKLAFAVTKHDGSVATGKLDAPSSSLRVAIPAVAYRDEKAGTWLYGYELENAGKRKNFINIVKIKALLSLLASQGTGRDKSTERERENENYYRNEHYFPEFFFPHLANDLAEFNEKVKNRLVFEVKEDTPMTVVQGFFRHAAELAAERAAVLSKEWDLSFTELRVCLVHPPKIGKKYIAELSRLVSELFPKAFQKLIKKTKSIEVRPLSSARALAYLAHHQKKIPKGETGILIFDIGEEEVSVVKCIVNRAGESVIEAPIDHSQPASIGGNDIDFAVADYIEQGIRDRETVGSPPVGSPEHITEEGLQSDQYLFLQEIKKAKLLLSLLEQDEVEGGKEMFRAGVPLCLYRDLMVQRNLTDKDFLLCLGARPPKTDEERSRLLHRKAPMAERLLAYIKNELSGEAYEALNREVKTVFLAGGPAESYGLLDYIRKTLEKDPAYKGLRIRSFDTKAAEGDENRSDSFTVLPHEDCVYASALGAALACHLRVEVYNALSYSYGTWVKMSGTNVKLLYIFKDGNRGQPLKQEITKIFSTTKTNGTIEDNEIFSTILTQEDVSYRRYADRVDYFPKNTPKSMPVVGEIGSPERKRAEAAIGLRTVAGGKGAGIQFFYRFPGAERDSRVKVKPLVGDTPIHLQEGIMVYKNGRAAHYVENITKPNENPTYLIEVTEVGGKRRSAKVHPSQIKAQTTIDLSSIDIDNDD